ncbi:hypothetical protein LEP1GSC036_3186 [Leptospira weilii str. 2006001853]|uniref:Uncharacterized protein n=4 Tax=Leptospira weilii TaxID=28184 RepID=A0A828Z0G2_9LEPT|nr:hypothetical protein LEP1GSC036_3186 [Leptospira weilii str. 2006001853]EMJ60891.1 hypothetical protein LEP1GSC051_2704 [Leptospira sp. P2653]EMM72381.1 hypothetical protein LEP1GSC038_3367 [Leptospira weilii str. 2006001855]EMN43582.1 hypothetical protein LEP1GSC086_0626 [Leptospira weilii str. LNT 1234]EMN91022.1 hypothetical protein LEP1GSC108_4360 [Leptospira weilii str. UI 13098]EMY15201.1 hypothetical protein LEP1GSC043_2153 [Leptospira weilii str. Ecochallenge]
MRGSSKLCVEVRVLMLDFALFSEKLTKNRYFYRNPDE